MPKLYRLQSIDPVRVPRFCEAEGFYTTPVRSRMMAGIKAVNTKPELAFRRALHGLGHRFRVGDKGLPGKPDVSNRAKRYAVFIDGAFWHGYDWEHKKYKIKKNRDFWIPKIERNRQRDQEVNAMLGAAGFAVFRFWDHEVRGNLSGCLLQLLVYLQEKEAE
ncbi:MAG: very short patch repair endonuclease [Bacteroidetes bacterium]|nr:very short patch repair endonuclease [Bacteroidota bacterium]